ncbi:esterase family protein [Trinickia terrae]|uniref:Esterase family protein n=1 Tax=Trinickia terrae TaxID=2571161 RepID=A0A4U1IFQ0_9BURK|nr:alpha/beta hydrolase-fold protein [Trinickia terrae]TKC92517.1 esterase family protein [Trinickia terrae]
MRTLLYFFAALICAAAAAPAPSFASTVAARTFHSEALERDWSYTVYLPTGYRDEGPRYPVLYLLHGNHGDANDWITQGQLQATADQLIERKEIPPVVIVMPQAGTDWYVDRKERMQTAFFDDLLPEIEARYWVSNQRGGRVIGGVSMGGFGALRYALLKPDQFCSAMLLSPAIYADVPPLTSAARYVGVFGERQFDPHVWHELNYPTLWSGYFSKPWRLPFFIAAGGDDLVIQAEADALYTHLRQANNPAALRIVDGAHTWDVWRGLIAPGLKYSLECVKGGAK